MHTVSTSQILATPMPQPNDAVAATVRDYLIALLGKLWKELDGFDAKRPFGYSSWTNDLHIALINAGHIRGTLNEDGELVSISDHNAQLGEILIATAINTLDAAAA